MDASSISRHRAHASKRLLWHDEAAPRRRLGGGRSRASAERTNAPTEPPAAAASAGEPAAKRSQSWMARDATPTTRSSSGTSAGVPSSNPAASAPLPQQPSSPPSSLLLLLLSPLQLSLSGARPCSRARLNAPLPRVPWNHCAPSSNHSPPATTPRSLRARPPTRAEPSSSVTRARPSRQRAETAPHPAKPAPMTTTSGCSAAAGALQRANRSSRPTAISSNEKEGGNSTMEE